jgi:hypothetical protein
MRGPVRSTRARIPRIAAPPPNWVGRIPGTRLSLRRRTQHTFPPPIPQCAGIADTACAARRRSFRRMRIARNRPGGRWNRFRRLDRQDDCSPAWRGMLLCIAGIPAGPLIILPIAIPISSSRDGSRTSAQIWRRDLSRNRPVLDTTIPAMDNSTAAVYSFSEYTEKYGFSRPQTGKTGIPIEASSDIHSTS